MDQAKNFAKVTVEGVYDDIVTSVDLIAGGGAKLPTTPFNAVWWNATDYPDPADDPFVEIVRVTAIATDTLTVARGEEGPSPGTGFEHALEGKLYRMAAGLTAKVINEDLLGTGATRLRVNTGTQVIEAVAEFIFLGDVDGAGNNTKVYIDDSTSAIGLQSSGNTFLGDIDGSGNGIIIDAPNSIIKHTGQFGTDQSASATVGVGTISKKLPIYDNAGTLLGYIPIYATIT